MKSKKYKIIMGNGELLGEYTFTLWEALILFPESCVVDDTIYLT
jgi:hypothetical protein